ncbi:MAG: type II toxin-antitoxin system RelE/ParE family toxin [Acidobacteria bacterium]|nr:type II toxin-antitoxin system RelE/ParE family toxin [Acidobacteriota bacterium]
MAKIAWTPQAADDLEAIAEYIALDSEHYSKLFIIEIVSSVERLANLPKRGHVVPEIRRSEIREIFVGSYRIIYRCREQTVEILTIYHGARLLKPETIEVPE